MAVVMCHEIPRLPNQSDWLSRYIFLGGISWPNPRLDVQSECLVTLTHPAALHLG